MWLVVAQGGTIVPRPGSSGARHHKELLIISTIDLFLNRFIFLLFVVFFIFAGQIGSFILGSIYYLVIDIQLVDSEGLKLEDLRLNRILRGVSLPLGHSC